MVSQPNSVSTHSSGTMLTEHRRFSALPLSELALVPAIFLLCVVGAFVNEAFFKPANILTILQQSSILALVVLAESLV